MLAIEASEMSAKIENKPQPNSLKKVFNKSNKIHWFDTDSNPTF